MPYNLALTKIEKEVLYRKYRQNGFNSNEANEKLQTFNQHLNKMAKSLVKEDKTPKQIENKFQEEFEKICRKLEV